MESTAPGITVRIATTSRELYRAHRLVAEGYALLGHSPLDIEEVYKEFYLSRRPFPDVTQDPVTTFVATGGDQVVATLSLVGCPPSSSARRYEQIEALRLLRPAAPWGDALRVAPNRIGELSRVSIRCDYRTTARADIKLWMFRSMLQMMLDQAERSGVGIVLAIMPPKVTRLVVQAGFALSAIEGVDLAHGDAHCDALYRRYPRYWLPDDPRLIPKLYAIADQRT